MEEEIPPPKLKNSMSGLWNLLLLIILLKIFSILGQILGIRSL